MNFLKLAWKKWLVVARVIGNFQSQVILSVFYFLILFPLGIFFSQFSDPLKIKAINKQRSNFGKWEHPREDLSAARKQF